MANLPSNLIDDSIVALAEGINKGVDVFADGFQFTDLFQFIPTALNIQAIVEKKDELVEQLKDYSLEERAASIEKLKGALSFSEDAEAITGIAYDVVFSLVRGVLYMAERSQA